LGVRSVLGAEIFIRALYGLTVAAGLLFRAEEMVAELLDEDVGVQEILLGDLFARNGHERQTRVGLIGDELPRGI
jgi:hypothetical protein